MGTQKFFTGDLVRIGKLSSMQSHFEQECDAIVMYSYAEQYGHGETDSFSVYILPNKGEVSWYYADDFTLIEPDRFDLLPRSNQHRRNWLAKQARDRDLVQWLRQGIKEKALT